MSSGSKGDDAPGDGGRGSGPQPQVSGRVVVRGDDHSAGDSTAVSAADTAMQSAAVAVTQSDAEVRKTPGRATPGPARGGTTSMLRSTPGLGRATDDPDPTPDG